MFQFPNGRRTTITITTTRTKYLNSFSPSPPSVKPKNQLRPSPRKDGKKKKESQEDVRNRATTDYSFANPFLRGSYKASEGSKRKMNVRKRLLGRSRAKEEEDGVDSDSPGFFSFLFFFSLSVVRNLKKTQKQMVYQILLLYVLCMVLPTLLQALLQSPNQLESSEPKISLTNLGSWIRRV